jgi:hypothetical protein
MDRLERILQHVRNLERMGYREALALGPAAAAERVLPDPTSCAALAAGIERATRRLRPYAVSAHCDYFVARGLERLRARYPETLPQDHAVTSDRAYLVGANAL